MCKGNDYANQNTWTLISGAVFFAFQIYGDFSGYSDIAIGSAKLFGIKLREEDKITPVDIVFLLISFGLFVFSLGFKS